MERTLTRHEVAHLLGVNIKTIHRWAIGRPYDTEDQILAFGHQTPITKGPRKTVAYCQVSGPI